MGHSTQPSEAVGTWVPVWTGFSVDPTNLIARWKKQFTGSKWCEFVLTPNTNGTSNATTVTVTLPFPAANNAQNAVIICRVINNGSPSYGILVTRVNSNIADVYINGGSVWTNSGAKNVQISGLYETT